MKNKFLLFYAGIVVLFMIACKSGNVKPLPGVEAIAADTIDKKIGFRVLTIDSTTFVNSLSPSGSFLLNNSANNKIKKVVFRFATSDFSDLGTSNMTLVGYSSIKQNGGADDGYHTKHVWLLTDTVGFVPDPKDSIIFGNIQIVRSEIRNLVTDHGQLVTFDMLVFLPQIIKDSHGRKQLTYTITLYEDGKPKFVEKIKKTSPPMNPSPPGRFD